MTLYTIDTGKSVFAAIEAIAATPSRIEKEAIFKSAGTSSKLFMKAAIYAYDPFKNYGISIAPHRTAGMAPTTNDLADPMVWKCLDDLNSRNLSGHSARDKVQMIVDFLDEPSSEVFRRIINRDMRAGFTDGTINRVFKGTIAEFPYMRCSLPAKSNMAKWDWSVGIICQEKADGMFANVNVDAAGIYITSRAGSMFPAGCLGIEEDMQKTLVAGTQSHGELTVFEAGVLLPREKGNGVLNSLLSGGSLEPDQRVVFEAWDQIPKSSVVSGGQYAVGYKNRLAALARQVVTANRSGLAAVVVIPTRIVKSKAEAYAHYRELLKKGKEGVVVKHPDAIWKDTTSKDQVKLKLEFEVDLEIKEFLPGTPGTKTEATFGSALCVTSDGQLEVGVSGFTDAMRLAMHSDRAKYLGSIMTVKANAIMAPEEGDEAHSLFLPRFVEHRTDRRTADDLERVKQIFQSALETA